jgi:decaprenylphospho-beta-D-erythro-pentofuranosid-2-ulose 2-reductase
MAFFLRYSRKGWGYESKYANGTKTESMKNILIIGATSAIAKEVARIYARQKLNLFLIARDGDKLNSMVEDLIIRGANRVGTAVLDANDFGKHGAAIDEVVKFLSGIDIALICHGSLPDQNLCADDFSHAQQEINTNGMSVISFLTILSHYFVGQNKGCIAVVTSVAGDRGRQPNYVYGAAKSLVSTYLQGLRGKLYPSNVHVVDIRPGFVDTPMTAQFEKGLLWTNPKEVAAIIVNSIRKKKHTVYAPRYWRFILFVVNLIPEFIFKRLKL